MRARRPLSRAALVTSLLAVLALGPVAPAAAHNPPPVPVPADGATLDAVPDEVRLDYSDVVLELGTTVKVVGPDDVDVTDGAAVVGDKVVTQPITDGGPGEYHVVWRVTSADGHPVDGESRFTVEAPERTEDVTEEPSETPTPEAVPTTEAPPTTSSPTDAPTDDPDGAGRSPLLVLGALALLGAGVAVLAKVRRGA